MYGVLGNGDMGARGRWGKDRARRRERRPAKEHAGLRKDSGLDWNGNRKTLSWIQTR